MYLIYQNSESARPQTQNLMHGPEQQHKLIKSHIYENDMSENGRKKGLWSNFYNHTYNNLFSKKGQVKADFA